MRPPGRRATDFIPGYREGEQLVSVVIPARDEVSDIEACVRALGAQDYPHSAMEILVVDGRSTDETADLACRSLAQCDFAHSELLTNDRQSTPVGLNLGLEAASGEFVCRVDARSIIPPDYVRRCVEVLAERDGVVVVGGRQKAIPPSDDAVGQGIARAVNNRWATGLSRYRSGRSSGPTDTVYLGVFRRSDLEEVGGWDEVLSTNQDFDLNRRLSSLGDVWYEAGLDVGYRPRRTVLQLFRQHQRFGTWKVFYWRYRGEGPRPRQWLLMLLPAVVGGAFAAWVLRGPHKLSRLALAGVAGVGVLEVVEVVGADEPATGWRGHQFGVVGLAAIGSGWLSGVIRGLFRGKAA